VFGSSPINNAADRYAQNIVCRLSLAVGEEPNACPARRFAEASGGIATSVISAKPTPSQLA
jgi:hypothetical protein